jgi:hypothetical protein
MFKYANFGFVLILLIIFVPCFYSAYAMLDYVDIYGGLHQLII